MKKIFLVLIVTSIALPVFGQQKRELLYNPEANGVTELATAVSKAAAENKHVLIQIGGNWCKWCYRFHDFIKSHPALDSLMTADFVVMHLNYSKENKNLEILSALGYPQRFGFPVFVIVDMNGERIHTQSSWFLEDGKESYDVEKVAAFLKDWNRNALNPANYPDEKK
ncbi:MAG: thioredoxin family protein [Bacteroidia bacterium]|nr:thioredoxin family protein [Bacteroidia bacterium]MCZ2276867.1 thioredoxin family protein [Bacteroidia bacterium]